MKMTAKAADLTFIIVECLRKRTVWYENPYRQKRLEIVRQFPMIPAKKSTSLREGNALSVQISNYDNIQSEKMLPISLRINGITCHDVELKPCHVSAFLLGKPARKCMHKCSIRRIRLIGVLGRKLCPSD